MTNYLRLKLYTDKSRHVTWGFMLLGLDQQSSTKCKASLQFRLDQQL